MTYETLHDNLARHDGAPEIRIFKDQLIRAKKAFSLPCGCTVNPGQTYRCVAGLEDGKFFVDKAHPYWASCPLMH